MIILWCSGEAMWLLSSGFEPNPSLQIGQCSPFCKEFRLPREVAAWLSSSFGGSVAAFMSLLVFWDELSGAVVVVVVEVTAVVVDEAVVAAVEMVVTVNQTVVKKVGVDEEAVEEVAAVVDPVVDAVTFNRNEN